MGRIKTRCYGLLVHDESNRQLRFYSAQQSNMEEMEESEQ